MRKISIFLFAVLVSIFPLTASAPIIQFSEENPNSFELYSPSAEKISTSDGINGFGYLIKTNDQPAKLTTELGDIYIDSDSYFLFVQDSPITLFLISGRTNIVLNEQLSEAIQIYTPTTKTAISEKGEYVFISTENEEQFYNFSGSDVYAFDGITAENTEVNPITFIDYLNSRKPQKATEDQYNELSAIKNVLFKAKNPNAPTVIVRAFLKSDTPSLPDLAVKKTELYRIVPNTPSLKILRTELITTVPKKPEFSITTISKLSKHTPNTVMLTSESELITMPVIIKGKFGSKVQVLEPKPAAPIVDEIKVESQDVQETATEIAPLSVSAEKKTEIRSSQVISGSPSKNFKFDLLFSTRAYTDSETQKQTLAFSFQPVFRYGAFALTLNLDPVHILSYTENATALDWARYSIAFLESLRYRSMNEHFSITLDRSTDVTGDSVGLYSGVNHLSDGKNEKLSLSVDISYPLFGMRIYANDLLLNTENKTVSGIDMNFNFSEKLPVGIALGLLSSSEINDYCSKLMLYPEFAFYLPFYTKSSDFVGMKVGMSLAIQPSEISNYSITKYGYLVSAILPLKFGNFTAEPGIHYANGPLHYNSVDSQSYFPITKDDSSILTIASKLKYSGKYAGGKANVFFDVALSNMTVIRENSFLDASLFININDLRISGGMTVQNFTTPESYQNSNSKYYGGIDFAFPGVTTYIKAGITDLANKKFFLTYGASASFFSSDISARKTKEKDENFPVHFDLITGYKYRFSSEKASYLLKPVVKFGKDSYFLALRAPIQLSFNDSREFIFEGQNGRIWWDFGTNEIDSSRKLFRAITDTVSLIDGIKLGEETNIAYLIAERGWRKNGTLFTAFGSDDVLSLRTGFNFTNLSLGLFVDDLENPHIGELSIGVLPVGKESLSIGIKVPGELLFVDLKNFDMNFYPEFRLDLPFFNRHFQISAIAIGNIGVKYDDGNPTRTSVIYDFENNRFSSAMIGGEMSFNFYNVDFYIQGGYRIGNLTPDMYNRFTSFYNEIPTPTSRLATSTATDDDGYYGKISTDIKFSKFRLELAYSAANIVTLFNDFKTANDIFSAKMDVDFNEALSFYASFDRRGFARLFAFDEKFLDVMKDKNTLFAVGLDFNYGILNLNAEFATALNSSGYSPSNPYININPVYIGTTTTSLSVTTRIHF